MTRTEEKSILNFASRAAIFLVSLSSSSFLLARNINTCNLSKSYLLARLNTRSLHSENCLLQRFFRISLSMKNYMAPCCEDVRNKQGEAAVIVEPPNIDGSRSLLGALLELGDVSHDLLWQWPLG